MFPIFNSMLIDELVHDIHCPQERRVVESKAVILCFQVEEVRRQTRQEKKRLAMETRKKELSRLGLRANDKEQITSQSTLLSKMGEIAEESGLVSIWMSILVF